MSYIQTNNHKVSLVSLVSIPYFRCSGQETDGPGLKPPKKPQQSKLNLTYHFYKQAKKFAEL